MLWDAKLIGKLLDLYKSNRVLWDQKHNNYSSVGAKQLALQSIQEELGLPLSPADIHRKYRTMRAAYQVEVRNIHAAKLRGFFYKPTLHWFDVFHQFIEDTEKMKAPKEEKLPTNTYAVNKATTGVRLLQDKKICMKKRKLDVPDYQTAEVSRKKVLVNRPIPMRREESVERSSEEGSSDESEDEFQSFADHIAQQLRTMTVHRAVMIQNQIQRLFAKNRETTAEEDFELA